MGTNEGLSFGIIRKILFVLILMAQLMKNKGEIIACEAVPKSKLLHSTVRVGSKTLSILSGIAKSYTPEQMIGKKVVIVANLAPRKMRGFISEGMLLAADMPDGSAKVIFVDGVEPGSKVR